MTSWDRSPWSNDPRFRAGAGDAPMMSPTPVGPPPPTPAVLPAPPAPAVQCKPSTPSPPREDDDFVEISEVEWAQDVEDNLSGELATRPKYEKVDPCGCSMPSGGTSYCCLDMSCVLYACQEECGSSCTAGPYCGNRRISLKLGKRLEVFDAGIKGRGLKTLEHVKQGDFLTEYVGRAIRKKYLDTLFRRYKNERMLYIMALDNQTYLDARKKGSNARYINHSCEPNCVVERWRVRGVLRCAVIALRDIPAGEELSFDYKWDRKRGRAPTKCYCLSKTCRGTLEMPRSLEEEELDRKLVGHWKKPLSKTPGSSIVNRSIRILSPEYHEYFSADVCKYDDNTKLHLVMYTHDREESWEDLAKEEWMILDEEAEKFVISRKSRTSMASPSLLELNRMDPSSLQQLKAIKNYLHVQTPVKDFLVNGRLIHKCQMNCHVDVGIVPFTNESKPPSDAEEAAELTQRLQESTDGTVHKLTIVGGSNMIKAFNFLAKNVAYFEKKQERTEESSSTIQKAIQEVLIPSTLVDPIKKRMYLIRNKCSSVQINFVNDPTRLILEALLVSDLATVTASLWKQLVIIFAEANRPGIVNEIGFLGGEVGADMFSQLCQHVDWTESPFFQAFQQNHCKVWVHSEDDSLRKIFFGCDPKEIPKYFGMLVQRMDDLAQGVKYLFVDKPFQTLILQPRLFEHVFKTTAATVTVDALTGNHLRIQGANASLAIEVIQLQIELYRDHYMRQRSWIFGRDWTQQVAPSNGKRNDVESSLSPRPPSPSSNSSVFDSKTVSNACVEIADIMSNLDLDSSFAVHAVLILYRFVSKLGTNSTQHKIRDLLSACVFLACKCQKTTRWKRLLQVLEASYTVFYGGKLDKTSQEATNCEKRVIAAELEILTTLEYDVFWSGADCIVGSGVLVERHLTRTLDLAFSGPILGAGSDLWLKYGPKYVFVAAAGLRAVPIEPLFTALSLSPERVAEAAKLIADSIQSSTYSKRTFDDEIDDRKVVKKMLLKVKEACSKQSNNGKSSTSTTLAEIGLSDAAMRCFMLGQREQDRRALLGISDNVLRDAIVPRIERICTESSCGVSVRKASSNETSDIVLAGNWRAISTAEYLIRKGLPSGVEKPGEASQSQNGENGIQTEIIPPDKKKDPVDGSTIACKTNPGALAAGCIATETSEKTSSQSDSADLDKRKSRKSTEKISVCSRVPRCDLIEADLRWWLPTQYIPSATGSIYGVVAATESDNGAIPMNSLMNVSRDAITSKTTSLRFPLLTQQLDDQRDMDRSVAVSVQRWPLAKIASREQSRASQSKRPCSQIGFSPAALQEMQLMSLLHALIPSPRGHPNFVLPVGIALPTERNDESVGDTEKNLDSKSSSPTAPDGGLDEEIFTLFRSNADSKREAEEEKRREIATNPYLLSETAPFVMHRLTSRSKKRRDSSLGDQLLSPVLLTAWMHDLLSALAHCHTNGVLLQFVQPDQIIVDHSGVLKLGNLYKATVLPSEERDTMVDPLENVKSKKDRRDDDGSIHPYAAPEILLGSTKYTKQTDVWSVACLIAQLLLQKPLFVGKDRKSLLLSTFKVVGIPSEGNYEKAEKFPFFQEPSKPYKRGVKRAFEYMLKDIDITKHEGVMDLLDRMLHLDPAKRITAVEALSHECMIQYMESSSSPEYQQEYVKDWLALKSRLVESGQIEQDEARKQQQGLKRKANFLMAASTMDNDDDLYDMDDLLGSKKMFAKKHKVEESS